MSLIFMQFSLLPGLEDGDRAFAAGADLRVGAVDGLLPA
jgi:hypothetical protein